MLVERTLVEFDLKPEFRGDPSLNRTDVRAKLNSLDAFLKAEGYECYPRGGDIITGLSGSIGVRRIQTDEEKIARDFFRLAKRAGLGGYYSRGSAFKSYTTPPETVQTT